MISLFLFLKRKRGKVERSIAIKHEKNHATFEAIAAIGAAIRIEVDYGPKIHHQKKKWVLLKEKR